MYFYLDSANMFSYANNMVVYVFSFMDYDGCTIDLTLKVHLSVDSCSVVIYFNNVHCSSHMVVFTIICCYFMIVLCGEATGKVG